MGFALGQGRERRVDGFERAYLSVGVGGDHLLDPADSLHPICAAITWFGRFSFAFM